MYASVREYRTKDNAEIARRAQEGFIPLVRAVPGFAAYYMIDAGEKFFTVTLAEDEAGVEASAEKAREWVGANAAELVEGAAVVSNGEVVAQS